jgi:hypothetical protein
VIPVQKSYGFSLSKKTKKQKNNRVKKSNKKAQVRKCLEEENKK